MILILGLFVKLSDAYPAEISVLVLNLALENELGRTVQNFDPFLKLYLLLCRKGIDQDREIGCGRSSRKEVLKGLLVP